MWHMLQHIFMLEFYSALVLLLFLENDIIGDNVHQIYITESRNVVTSVAV